MSRIRTASRYPDHDPAPALDPSSNLRSGIHGRLACAIARVIRRTHGNAIVKSHFFGPAMQK